MSDHLGPCVALAGHVLPFIRPTSPQHPEDHSEDAYDDTFNFQSSNMPVLPVMVLEHS